MTAPVNRREFITASAALAAGMGLGARAADAGTQQTTPAAPAAPLTFKTKLRKALIARPTEEDLTQIKAAGFDGVEGRVMPPDEAAKMRVVAEKIGLQIHSVTRGWAEFNNPDTSVAQKTFDVTEGSLRTAEAFGADAILLVPCWIGRAAGPRHAGDHAAATGNTRSSSMRRPGTSRAWSTTTTRAFADYIKVHNHATDTSKEWVRRLIPLAEKTRVIIALENVTNHLWVKPDLFSHFVRSFQSPWVKAYFDIGNHVRFAPPEQWILALGDQTVRIHVKDYRLDPADPNGMGQGVNIREGHVRWPVLRQALEIGELQRLDDDRRQRQPVHGGTQPTARPDHRGRVAGGSEAQSRQAEA